MPSHEEHCRSSFQLYGIRAEDIHSWMDAPSQIYGSNHRWTRHNLALIPKKFADKYGEELARQIMLDHILLDKEGELRIQLFSVDSKVLPPLNLKRKDDLQPVRVTLVLMSLFVWIAGLGYLFFITLRPSWCVWLWVGASLFWWLIGLPLCCDYPERVRNRRAEEAILEKHR